MRRAAFLLALPLTLALTGEARACTVPVFRYALERWKPSPYRVTVSHRGPLSDDQRRLVQRLEQSTANVSVTTVPGEPRVTVHAPDAEDDPLSTGPLDAAFIDSLLDSPARQKIAQALGSGESAVWILLDGDDKTAAMLTAELARLSADLKLPEPDTRDLLSTKVPLKLSFVVVRVSRSDPREARLVEMLLHGDDDLSQVKGPIAFPVFGRGRVRLALHGEKLRPTEIERWASSLCGPCSCLLKELNPGFDLLLAADWEAMLDLGPSPEEKPAVAAPPIPPGPTEEAKIFSQAESNSLWYMLAGAGLLVALTAALALRDRASRP